MSATTTLSPSATSDPRRQAVTELAGMEARRHLRSPILVVALVFSAVSAAMMLGGEEDWSGGAYSLWPSNFVPLAVGAFYACLRSAGRDRKVDLPALAEEAPIGDRDRAEAHLLAAGVFPAIAVAASLIAHVASRIEGGYWIGEGAWRTDTAQHTVLELVQPVLLVALGAAAGVAAGRRWRRGAPIGVAAAFIGFLQWGAWWAFQFVPMIYVSPLVASPFSRWVAPASESAPNFPSSWWVETPGEFSDYWRHVYVDQPFLLGHLLYLGGLIALLAGTALRPPSRERSAESRRLRRLGWALVLVGLVVEMWALGWVFTFGGHGEMQVA